MISPDSLFRWLIRFHSYRRSPGTEKKPGGHLDTANRRISASDKNHPPFSMHRRIQRSNHLQTVSTMRTHQTMYALLVSIVWGNSYTPRYSGARASKNQSLFSTRALISLTVPCTVRFPGIKTEYHRRYNAISFSLFIFYFVCSLLFCTFATVPGGCAPPLPFNQYPDDCAAWSALTRLWWLRTHSFLPFT